MTLSPTSVGPDFDRFSPTQSVTPVSRSAWLRGSTVYFLVVLLLALVPYPLQLGRHWASAVFEPPHYLNRDAPEWIAMAEAKPFLSAAPAMRISRPLYPLPAFVIRQATDPASISTARIYRILNLAWFLLAAGLLRWWTLYWTTDGWAALAAGILFASSSFVQVYLSQPVPEMVGAAVSIGVLCTAAWAAGWQVRLPDRPPTRREKARARKRRKPWVWAGVCTAVLMLGKEIYALYVCLLLIAVRRRAWRRLAAFAAAALVIHLGYLAWVRWGLARPYTPYGENAQGFVAWVYQDLWRRPLDMQATFLARLAGRIVVRTAQAFWVWPLAFALVGALRLVRRPRAFDVFAFGAGYYLLFVATNVVTPRMCYSFFFPVVLPLAGAGLVGFIREVHAGSGRAGRLFWYAVLGLGVLLGILVDPFTIFYFG